VLLIALGLVLFAVGGIYLNYLVDPTDLPFLGRFIGSQAVRMTIPNSRAKSHQSPSGCRFTTRMRLQIMNRPAGFSAIAAANAARTRASARQIRQRLVGLPLDQAVGSKTGDRLPLSLDRGLAFSAAHRSAPPRFRETRTHRSG
jgi:hypothetical protein